MTKLLGFNLSDYDLVKYENIPTMQVKYWSSDNSYSLAPEWSARQMMYSSVLSTDDGYSKEDLQDIADEFNNNSALVEEYNKARLLAVNSLISYNKKKIKESKVELTRLVSLQQEMGKPEL